MIGREKLFIDTGAWIALLDAGDQFHRQASSFYKMLNMSVQRVTSSHVAAETYTWLRYRAGAAHAATFLNVVKQARTTGSLTVIRDDEELLDQAEQVLLAFQDQKLSYADALSMTIMKKEKIARVFGFDRHFQLMKFEVVPD